jgi:phytoene synthase
VTTAADELSSLTQTVREQDRDRYLATLFAPAAARDALFALYAFDQEIARARRIASEPMIALIRLQWWRDALDGLERGRVLAHPVVEALDRAIAGGRLTPAPLEQAISGREHEVEDPPPADLEAGPALARRRDERPIRQLQVETRPVVRLEDLDADADDAPRDGARRGPDDARRVVDRK